MNEKKDKNISQFIWVPRILTIVFILSVGSVSLNGFRMGGSFFSNLNGFFIYSIPSLVIMGMLIIFWKDPMKAGYGMFLATAGFTGYFKSYQNASSFIFLTVIPVLAAALFFYAYVKKDRDEFKEMQVEMAKMEEKKQKLTNQSVKLNAKQKAKLKATHKEMQNTK